MLLEKEVTMNLNYRGHSIVLDALQGDNCRVLTIRFHAGEAPWMIPTDACILLQYQLDDGTGGVYDTLADGSAACCVQENTVTISLISQLFAISGISKLQVIFLQEEKQLTSFEIKIRVQPKLNPQATEREYVNLSQWLHSHRGELMSDHSIYFEMEQDGTVSLKKEYTATGEKNASLPRHLIIPDVINGRCVTGIAAGAFERNQMLESIVLPVGVTVIPENCFYGCIHLQAVYSASQVTQIGSNGFARSAMEEAHFPNLEVLGESVFDCCINLKSADVGKVTELPFRTFRFCPYLRQIKGGKNIATVGDAACMMTPGLLDAEFVGDNLREIKYGAFLCSGLVCDWNSLENCLFHSYAVSAVPPTVTDKFWKTANSTITARENPLPTLLCQTDNRWIYKTIGNSETPYGVGCLLLSYIHAYCGLTGLHLDTVEEFESIANTIQSGLLDNYQGYHSAIYPIAEALGMSVETLTNIDGSRSAENLERLYTALANGKYAVVTTANGATSENDSPYEGTSKESSVTRGHAVLVYGIRPDGKLLVADSRAGDRRDDTKALRFALPAQALMNPLLELDILTLRGTAFYHAEALVDLNSNTQTYHGEVE